MTKSEKKRVQVALKKKGFYRGKIDGIWGRLTRKAIIGFKKSVGLRAQAYVGPITLAALFEDRPAVPAVKGEPKWLRVARTYMGLREYKGRRHNEKILSWWNLIRQNFGDDETPWCAGYVGGVFEEVGIRSSRSAMARSYDKWGRGLSRPAVGCVVTFWRGSPGSWKGHVAFVVGRDQSGNLMCLGGNQSDAVNIKAFSKGRIAKFRWPENVEDRPNYDLPIVRSDGSVSRNEA